jgi:cysteine-rich repeat protein
VPDIYNAMAEFFAVCGDNTCNFNEDCSSCQQDCGNCTTPGSTHNTSFPQDYIAFWRFEGNADDETGQNNGTLVGDAQYIAGGQVGQAIEMDGDDAVDIGEPAGLDVPFSELTLSVWVNSNIDSTYYKGLVCKGTLWCIYLTSGGSMVDFYHTNVGDGRTSVSIPDIQAGTWHHIIAIYNGSETKVYVDGTSYGGENASGTIGTNNNEVTIGSLSPTYGHKWIGSIDEVLIYDRALNETEVLQVFTAQGGGLPCFDDPGCTATGSFCDTTTKIPYDCTMGGDGCLNRWDGATCNTGDICLNGQCVNQFCLTISQCSDYNQSTCQQDNCSVGSIGCVWNSGTSSCDDACAGKTQCSDYSIPGNCNSNACGVAGPGCIWNSTSNNCEVVIIGACGNGIIEGIEKCDDGNKNSGDGCDSSCKIEQGYWCMLQPSNCSLHTWTAPIGIPYPEFGIGETHMMYKLHGPETCTSNPEKCYDFGSGLMPYPDAGNGPYTHYIDNSGACTDDINPGDNANFGLPSNPRCTFPTKKFSGYPRNYFSPGTVVEVHGGPYDSNVLTNGVLLSEANTSQPAFLRGVGMPVFLNRSFEIYGYHLIIENFTFNNSGLKAVLGYYIPIRSANYFSIRNNEFEGNGRIDSTAGIGSHSGSGNEVTYLVIYNNHIHHNGHHDHPQVSGSGDFLDKHGVGIGQYSENIWILDNHIHHNGGDSMQIGNDAFRTTKNIYIGRNDMHDDRENAVDIKQAENVVISQNRMYNYWELGRNDDGLSIGVTHQRMTPTDGPKNIWWIFNEMFNCTRAAHSSHSGEELYLIGNVIHDVGGAFGSSNFYGGETQYYIGNTIYNTTAGIHPQRGSGLPPLTGPYYIVIENNIIDSLTQGTASYRHLWLEDYPNYVTFDNNLFYQQGGQVMINWDDTPFTLGEIQSMYGQCLNCIEADTEFEDKANFDVHLKPTSQAIDNGTLSTAYDTFQQRFGVDIRKDFEGTARPQGAGWDIGAYEH